MHKYSQSKNDSYYEAIIQIRPKKDIVLSYIRDTTRKLPDIVSRTIEKKFGYDLYIRDRKVATHLSRKIKKRFKAIIKVSKSLHSRDRQTSKLLYRLTILIKLK